MDDQIGAIVHRRRVAVDEDQVLSLEIVHKSCRRINGQACTGDDHRVRCTDVVYSGGEHIVVQPLLVQHDFGLDHAAAAALGNADRIADILRREELRALQASVAMDGAVQFQHGFAACFLMESVDVLGDDGAQTASLFQCSKEMMCRIGLGFKGEHLVAVETVELLRMAAEEGSRQDGFRRKCVCLVVQPVHAAEVGNARFGAYARAAEEHDSAGGGDDLL